MGPLEISDITEETVKLSWQPPESDGGTPVTGYLVDKYDTKRMTWSKVATVDDKTLTCVVPRLLEGQKYEFRVSAINSEGQGPALKSDKEIVPSKPPGNDLTNSSLSGSLQLLEGKSAEFVISVETSSLEILIILRRNTVNVEIFAWG